MHTFRHAAFALALALLAGCAAPMGASPGADATATDRPTRSEPPRETVRPSDDPMTGEVPVRILAALLADAADRLGVREDAIEAVQAEAVTWNDGSLGCPERGMSYTMALVEGYHVILASGGEELDYRVTEDGNFRLCESGGRPSQ